MRALRRIATPASLALTLGGCSLPVDDFQAPPSAKSDAGLATNGDAAGYGEETAADAADAADASECVCVREVNGKCKQWSHPSCAK